MHLPAFVGFDQVTELSEANERSLEATLRSILAYETIQIVLDTYEACVEQSFDCFIQAFVGHKVNVLVIVIKIDQIRFDGKANHFGPFFSLTHIRRNYIIVNQI